MQWKVVNAETLQSKGWGLTAIHLIEYKYSEYKKNSDNKESRKQVTQFKAGLYSLSLDLSSPVIVLYHRLLAATLGWDSEDLTATTIFCDLGQNNHSTKSRKHICTKKTAKLVITLGIKFPVQNHKHEQPKQYTSSRNLSMKGPEKAI